MQFLGQLIIIKCFILVYQVVDFSSNIYFQVFLIGFKVFNQVCQYFGGLSVLFWVKLEDRWIQLQFYRYVLGKIIQGGLCLVVCEVQGMLVLLMVFIGYFICYVEFWGDSGVMCVQLLMFSQVVFCQEDMVGFLLVFLCVEVVGVLVFQEDFCIFLVKVFFQGEVWVVLNQVLFKEVLGVIVVRVLFQSMLSMVLVKVLFWSELCLILF